MNTTESEHDWFCEQIATYLADGLDSAEERTRFESHAQECPQCAEELKRSEQIEREMNGLFVEVEPAADFEERVVGRLRLSAKHRRVMPPMARKIAVAAAAAIVVGGFGWVGKQFVEQGEFPRPVAMQSAGGWAGAPQSRSASEPVALNVKYTDAETLKRDEFALKIQPSMRETLDYGFAEKDQVYTGNISGGASLDQIRAGAGTQVLAGAVGAPENLPKNSPSMTIVAGGVLDDVRAPLPALRKNETNEGTFVGAGKVSGNDRLVKAGSGSLVLSGASTFTGGVRIAGGTIGVSSNSSRFEPAKFGADQASPAQVMNRPQISAANTVTSQTSSLATDGPLFGDGHVNFPDRKVQYDQLAQVQQRDVDGPPMQLFAQVPTTQPTGGTGGAVMTTAQATAQARKVIRSGSMDFEVDSFDSAFTQISRITVEEGGFISAADSDKLPNGKVRGVVTVRVPPDRLDTLVMKLRALGELKGQKLGSTDIGKEYTDLESELRAARAMEERLLEMIKTAQGKVAELLAAEKELGTWRTKIEKIQGQLIYYNNLISMATLTVSAAEKDIRTPALASEREEISAGVETEDVEAARAAATKSIDDVKGRIVESTLQKLEAGQFAAKIVAEVPPENAGQIVDRLRQLGRIARMDSQRRQTTDTAKPPMVNQAPVRIEQAPTRLVISMYNLANVAPRLTTNLHIATEDVEATYRAALKRITDASGRVISSNLNRENAVQAVGTVQFEVKAADADAVLNDLRRNVQVLTLNVNENLDTANVTTAKQAFTMQIIPATQVAPRETRTLSVETSEVEKAMQDLTAAAISSGGRTLESSLSQDASGNTAAKLTIELPLDKADALVAAAKQRGKVRTAESSKNAQVPEGPLTRARLNLTIGTGETIVPKEGGLFHTIRGGLSTSVKGLLWSLELIVIGLCLVGPWVLLIWGGWRFAKRWKRSAQLSPLPPGEGVA